MALSEMAPFPMAYIYGLLDPGAGALRYVGKANNPEQRLREHLSRARHDSRNDHLANWLRSLMQKGGLPMLILLERTPVRDWQETERRWIKELRERGVQLINETPGGEGQPAGDAFPEKVRRRLHEANAGRVMSEDQKRKIAATLRGRIPWNKGLARPEIRTRVLLTCIECGARYERTPSQLRRYRSTFCRRACKDANQSKSLRGENNPYYGRTPSPELRSMLAASRIGRKATPETRAKMSASHRARRLDPAARIGIDEALAAGRRIRQENANEINAKISAALRGKPKSQEHRRKLSESHYRHHAQRCQDGLQPGE